MKYILQLTKICYIERNEHTVGYSKLCKSIAASFTSHNYMSNAKAMLVEWAEGVEGDRRKKIVKYVWSLMDKNVNVADFSFDVRIYRINDNTDMFYLDGYGAEVTYIEPKQFEISE